MDDIALARAADMVREAVTEAGKDLLPFYGNIEPERKNGIGGYVKNVVTKLDVQVEQTLYDKFTAFDPNIGFQGEEMGIRKESSLTWLVDPIDGTNHFVRGLPFCTTMVALIDHHQVIMSVIYDFVHEDAYWAIKGQGAYKNETRLSVGSRSLSEGLFCYETNLQINNNLDSWLTLRRSSSVMNTINSGFEFAMVASGKLDGRIAKDPFGEHHDYAPGSLLVAEAGGIVRNIGTSTYDYRNHDYLAVNPVAYRQLTEGPTALFPVHSQVD